MDCLPRERRALYATVRRKVTRGVKKTSFFLVRLSLFQHFAIGRADSARTENCDANLRGGYIMVKILTAAAASFAMLSAAAAADLPRRQPPPPAPAPVGKAPIGKFPVGKYPAPAPAPVYTKG
jgi:hypothetical protein